MNQPRLVVSGGLGFIGAQFVRNACTAGADVDVIDLDTYAGDERRLESVAGRYTLHTADVSDGVVPLLDELRPDVVVHMAAESHVTRSETADEGFRKTNLEGTRKVLEAAEVARTGLVIHISTDEVYGPCEGAPFKEGDKEPGNGRATSPYAKSKALADDLAVSFMSRVPLIVVRPTNCFGPWQHPEKAIARWTIRAVTGQPIPVWGDGGYVRDWMSVDDACAAIRLLIDRGRPGEIYNVAPEDSQRTNLEVARRIARAARCAEDAVYLTAYDRPAHDRRYAIDASKLRSLGWTPERNLEEALDETVGWYLDNKGWWSPLLSAAEALYSDDLERTDSG